MARTSIPPEQDRVLQEIIKQLASGPKTMEQLADAITADKKTILNKINKGIVLELLSKSQFPDTLYWSIPLFRNKPDNSIPFKTTWLMTLICALHYKSDIPKLIELLQQLYDKMEDRGGNQ